MAVRSTRTPTGTQTYLGLREQLAANEWVRSFVHESTHGRTPLGHVRCEHICSLSVEQVREMYWQAMNSLLEEAAETEEFRRAEIVTIGITESDPVHRRQGGP